MTASITEMLPENAVVRALESHRLQDVYCGNNPSHNRFSTFQWKCSCGWNGNPFNMHSPGERRQARGAADWHVAEQVVVRLQLKELKDGEQAPDQRHQRRDGGGAVPA